MSVPFDPSIDLLIHGGGERARRALHDFIVTGHVETANGREIDLGGAVPCTSETRYWGDPSEWEVETYGIGDPEGHAYARVCLAVEDWYRLQHFLGNQKYSIEEFYDAAEQRTVERARETIRTGRGAIPAPVLPFNPDGTVHYYQEGRSRGLAAKLEGLTWVPVWVVAADD